MSLQHRLNHRHSPASLHHNHYSPVSPPTLAADWAWLVSTVSGTEHSGCVSDGADQAVPPLR